MSGGCSAAAGRIGSSDRLGVGRGTGDSVVRALQFAIAESRVALAEPPAGASRPGSLGLNGADAVRHRVEPVLGLS